MKKSLCHGLKSVLFSIAAAAVALASWAEGTFSDERSALESGKQFSQVSVDGNRFVDASGETVVFRGLALVDAAALVDRGTWSREYFEKAASWNANVVRLPVHPRDWRRLGEEGYLKLLDQAVQWSAELGMYVIIDWHSIGNPLTDVYHRPMYKTDRGETFRFWHTIAMRYKDNAAVPFFELWNEPTNQSGRMGRLPWSDYKAYMEELIFMIKAIDPKKIPLVAGFNFGYDLTDVKKDPISFPGVAYVAHPYPQKRPAPWIEDWERDWGYVADRYPMICTEFGFMSEDGPGAHVPVIGDEVYGEALISYFEKKGISWTAWVFDHRWSPQLYSDKDYTPTRQGTFFKAKMEELNQ
ncbi:glycoside hydrolase family 5 protein [Pelagicoccus sp. SDUM812002]|uniref:glycoside hydrolase family 5 protein n=1 Tax=Pelagicoccus sp. SDUM812002 TaxID=3041266 RepID=UPI00280CBA69|nr:glycoside hydrolase family 5 protein [Pelagicoccus sp. SDUM812002]MDQ8186248.1 glycoside hydrolase family 5 protein [Pelagicoccus sp. SDUM812002]